jgi:hypothetical protein
MTAAITTCLLGVLACLATPAQAARIHPLLLAEQLPEGRVPGALAVDQSTHHFYVVNGNQNGDDRRVWNYEGNGQLDLATPELTGTPAFFTPRQVAVDNSGGSHDGYVYVSGTSGQFVTETEGRVVQFGPDGEATGVTIDISSVPPDGTPQSGGLPPVVNKGTAAEVPFSVTAPAVDGNGNVFVVEQNAKAIDVFDPAGAFVRQLGAGKIKLASAIAIDAAGDIYLGNKGPEGLGQGLFELDGATGECIPVGCAPIDPAPVAGLAIDQAGGAIYTTAQPVFGEEGFEPHFSEYDLATHALLGVTRGPQLHQPVGIGVQESSGEVLIADQEPPPGEATIQIYGPVAVVPDAVTLSPEGVTERSATLEGEIGAAGVAGATCSFQYVTDEEFEAHRFEGAAEVPCEPAGPFSGEAMNAVHATLSGLRGGTTYHERIVGSNENGSNGGADEPFITLGPSVSGTEAMGITGTEATLKGAVDPRGSATTYRFQYLTQAEFEESGWAAAIETPAGGGSVGAGTTPVAVSTTIGGLASGTTYRLRIVAASTGGPDAGQTEGEEVRFTTFVPSSPGLPDGRRYEQASPVDKNGADIQGSIDSVQASLSGDRVTFFANTGIPGGEGSQEFPTYMAARAADGSGWSTEGLLPPATYGPVAHVLGWTEGLEDTYDYASEESAGALGSLLLRSNTAGSVTQVSTAPPENNSLAFAGSSNGGAVALVESMKGGVLPDDLAGKQNVYVYDREADRLVIAGLMNDGSVPPGGAMAGPYAWRGKSTEVGGGAVQRYYTQPIHAISADGTKVFFTAGGTGQLYVRLNPFAPQSAVDGEGACTEAAKACTVRISAPVEGVADPGTPAAFVGASVDGRSAFFLDRGKLTADATGGSGFDLYRYDLASGSLADLTLDAVDKAGARVEGVLGISRDGRRLYIAAAGALNGEASQAPAGEANLYAVDGATTRLIGRLGEELNWTPVATTAGGTHITRTSRVSADGSTLLFSSRRELTGYRNHGFAELYLYRAGGGVTCISCNPSGEAPVGGAGVQEIRAPSIKIESHYNFMTRNLSADGRRVVFDSADKLLPADHNDVNDVYEWEAPGKGSCTAASAAYQPSSEGCLFLISGGAAGVRPSYLGDVDEEGENIFFFTDERLVAQDKDELVDVYDARVGGGIAAQEAEPAAPCEGEACLGPSSSAPALATPGTSTFVGPENGKRPKPCRHRKVRRHGKCVAKHKGHHHKKHKKKHHHKQEQKRKAKRHGKGGGR